MPNLHRPKVVIFSQGDEVITGATVDTNAAFLADHCRSLGFDIVRHITVADELLDLTRVLQEIDELADLCLCTGGLGPTQDDLTTEAFAKAFNVELVFDEVALAMMCDYFKKLNVDMPDINRKQAYLPKNTTRIDNHWGTAPGFIGKGQRCRFYFMPGVPYEMKNMMATFVLDDLRSMFNVLPTQLVTLRIMGMGESAIQQEINALAIADDIRISFRAGLPENELKLTFPDAYEKHQIQQCVDKVRQTLGDCVYAVDGLDQSIKNLADCVHQLMVEKGRTLSLVETLSQGDIARQCDTSYLTKAAVFPQVSGIMSQLKMPNTLVNELAALTIARKEHAVQPSGITLVQLYEENEKGDLLVYIAVVGNQTEKTVSKTITGRLERQRVIASAMALNTLRIYLLED